MKLFKSKESCKEKFDSNNNWTAWARKILEWFLSFVGKHLKFLPKRYLFIFCIFHLNEKELNQQVCLIKYVENEISNSTYHQKKKEKKKKRGAKT